MVDPFVGRTFSSESLQRSTFPLLIEADQLFRLFNYEESLLVLDNAVAQDPYSSEALVTRAKLKRILGMNREASQDIMLAQRINPYAASLYGYHGNSGLLNIIVTQPEQAFEGLNSQQKLNYYYQLIDSKLLFNELSIEELELMEQIIEEIDNEQIENATFWVESLLAQHPRSAIAYDLKGLLLVKQQRLDEAAQAFKQAIEFDPEFAIAWYNQGQLELHKGNFESAKTYFDKAIALQENLTKAYFDRAMVLKKMGDHEEALKDYNHIIELQGEAYLEAYLNRGLTKKMSGDYLGAAADLDKVIEESPENAQLYKNRGNLKLLFGLPMQAIEDYSKAIQIDKEYAEAYFNRGLAHLRVYDKISGCYDLKKSADLGFEKAKEKHKYFCSGVITR